MISYPVVKVTWLDTTVDNSWQDISNPDPYNGTCSTIGYLIKEDEDVLVIASTIDLTEDLMVGVISIPVSSVEEIIVVNV